MRKFFNRMGIVLLFSTCFILQLNAQQAHERIIKKTSWPNEPLQLVAVKIKDRPVEFDKKFLADDNWWCDLKLNVTNTSEKEIVYFNVDLIIHHPEESSDKPTFIYPYQLGPSPWFFDKWEIPEGLQVLKPKETREIKFGGFSGCELRREDIRKFNRTDKVDQVEVLVRDLAFNRDLVWRKGQMLRRDAKEPYVWHVIGK